MFLRRSNERLLRGYFGPQNLFLSLCWTGNICIAGNGTWIDHMKVKSCTSWTIWLLIWEHVSKTNKVQTLFKCKIAESHINTFFPEPERSYSWLSACIVHSHLEFNPQNFKWIPLFSQEQFLSIVPEIIPNHFWMWPKKTNSLEISKVQVWN